MIIDDSFREWLGTLNGFTVRAARVIEQAQREAYRYKHTYLGTEHIALGLIKQRSGIAILVLKNLRVDLRYVRREVENFLHRTYDIETNEPLKPTPRAEKAVQYAMEEARHQNRNKVDTEHLLVGLIHERVGVAAIALRLDIEDVRKEIAKLSGPA